tara:strand:- start:19 stop:438 length:420 start_codon:yes stop_codon:yes gene_type:complete
MQETFDRNIYEGAQQLAQQIGAAQQERIDELEQEKVHLQQVIQKAEALKEEHRRYFEFYQQANGQGETAMTLTVDDPTVVYCLNEIGQRLRDNFNVAALQGLEGVDMVTKVAQMAVEHAISDGYDVFIGTASLGDYGRT